MPPPPINDPYLGFSPPTDPRFLGNIPESIATSFNIAVRDLIGSLPCSVSSVSSSNPNFTFPGFAPFSVSAGMTHNIVCSVTPTVLGAISTLITVRSDASNDPISITITANSVSVASGAIVKAVPNPVNLTGVKINTTSPAGLQMQNPGSGAYAVNTMVMTGDPTWVLTPPTLPFTVNPAAVIPITLNWTPVGVGPSSALLTLTTNQPPPQDTLAVVLTGVCVPLTPAAFSALTGATFGFVLGSADGSIREFTEGDFNGLDSSLFDFNGILWGAITQEKTLVRLYVIYENVGVCTLTATAVVFRPQLGSADSPDTVTDTITIGTALADGSIRSAYFDFQASGEIINLQITRVGGTPPPPPLTIPGTAMPWNPNDVGAPYYVTVAGTPGIQIPCVPGQVISLTYLSGLTSTGPVPGFPLTDGLGQGLLTTGGVHAWPSDRLPGGFTTGSQGECCGAFIDVTGVVLLTVRIDDIVTLPPAPAGTVALSIGVNDNHDFTDNTGSWVYAYLPGTGTPGAGPFSIVGFVPIFDVKGEKIEGV